MVLSVMLYCLLLFTQQVISSSRDIFRPEPTHFALTLGLLNTSRGVSLELPNNDTKTVPSKLLNVVYKVTPERDTITADVDVVKQRYFKNNFVTIPEAKQLTNIGKDILDGKVHREESSFSYQLNYVGLTLVAAANSAVQGNISNDATRLYLRTSERIRQEVARRFKLQVPLYHHFTQIVCRTPDIESPLVTNGQYRPPHSDNCVLNITEKSCHYDRAEAYTWRHYTSLVYLNDDFEGGSFFFSHGVDDPLPEKWVHPQVGQMVAFSAGQENIHGVTFTRKGVRCILEQWFTIDPAYQDRDYYRALNILSSH